MGTGAGAPGNDNGLAHYRDGGPGHRGADTSIEAAKFIAPRAPSIEARLAAAYENFAARGGATNDEACAAIGLLCWKGRPRTTGLKNRGVIVDSGARRPSSEGISSTVWRWVPAEERKPLIRVDGQADATYPTDPETVAA